MNTNFLLRRPYFSFAAGRAYVVIHVTGVVTPVDAVCGGGGSSSYSDQILNSYVTGRC